MQRLQQIIIACVISVVAPGVQAEGIRGMVSITFDDASLSQYTHGLRIAGEYRVPGTLFVSTHDVNLAAEQTDPWAMTWGNVNAFVAAGWEIGSHTHMHSRMTELSQEQQHFEIAHSHNLIVEHTGVTPMAYASPFGDFDDGVVDQVLEQYRYHLRAWGGNGGHNSMLELDPRDIGRLDVPFDMHPSRVCGEMLQAGLDETWLVLIFHNIVDRVPLEYEVSLNNFRHMMRCARALENQGLVSLVTISEGASIVQSNASQ